MEYTILILLLPFLSFLALGLGGKWMSHRTAGLIGTAALSVVAVLSYLTAGMYFSAPRLADGTYEALMPIDEDTYKESQVSKTGHDKSLLRSGNSRRLRIIETNQQIGGHAHQLPEQIHLEDIRCYYQSEHGHGEERQEGVVTLETAFALHVAERVYVYQQRNGTDDHEHHNRNRVE